MYLLQKYLPDYGFSERHSLVISAPQADVMMAVQGYRPGRDPFFRLAIAARELPMRLLDRLKARQHSPLPPFGLHNFVVLEQADDEEIVYGLAGQFWKLDYGLSAVSDAQAFLAFQAAGCAKLALGFHLEKLGDGRIRLLTETRVLCLDRDALRKFTPYWYLIRPVSGLIRQRMLASIGHTALRLAQPATPT